MEKYYLQISAAESFSELETIRIEIRDDDFLDIDEKEELINYIKQITRGL
jgi:hypothetical protein